QITKINFDVSKPKVSLITTGGTITSRVDYETGGVTSLMKPDELLSNTPELAGVVNITDIVSPFTRMSESISFEDYSDLGKCVEKELNKTGAVIVTHGTDTLHYTAAALSFMFHETRLPIILTAAQRSSDRPSSDASMNLVCSAYAAAYDFGETGVCIHGSSSDDYCNFMRGTKVRKMHTSRRDTFRPINDVPFAKIFPDGKIEKISEYRKRIDCDAKAFIGFEEKTALIKFAPNLSPEVIDFYADKKYKGIVIEATGLGQVALDTKKKEKSWLPSVKSAIDAGVVVCFAPQTLYGRLDPFVYAEARKYHEAGVIFLEDMLPETAYVKLAWLLANEKKDASKLMLHNYAGEISKRTLTETFLY
ncbi:Glu-tRNA(Gln) amidotransferase subunit GatD, partial [Candidatus Micrarchaeota archaeon]|nr:Glu-tRNA(Gln) amidotransferase subunit GatD [Candidatus Micrarchaeota archaeon]